MNEAVAFVYSLNRLLIDDSFLCPSTVCFIVSWRKVSAWHEPARAGWPALPRQPHYSACLPIPFTSPSEYDFSEP